MRFLADESCDFRVVVALRQAGHEVISIMETARGASDSEVIEAARSSGMVLLTEDRDFGQLVFAAGAGAGRGVLFIRCPEAARPTLPERIVAVVDRLGGDLAGAFAVWSPARLRVRRASRP